MKRPSAINTKVHDDSDLLATTAPSSSQTFVEEPASPSNNEAISDSESISDSRLRKKRSTYQKIPDDIRVNLLEAVQNGETLKAAAKRHKINYSSAKSILHTYRKEGRILKKSAQERTIKRKGDTSQDDEEEPKPVKQCKKENMHPSADSKSSRPINSSKKPLAQSSTDNTSSNNKLNAKKNQSSAEDAKPLTEISKSHKEASANNTADHRDSSEVNHTGNFDHLHHKSKPFDNYHGNYMSASLSEAGDHGMNFDPFNDLLHSLHHKSHPNDEMYHSSNSFAFPQVFGHSNTHDEKNGNGMTFEDFHLDGLAHCPLKSFMDTQNLFREALRKASFFSNGGNTSGVRKDSIDFFKM